MDGQRFDEWAKTLARLGDAGTGAAPSRRRLVRGLIGGAAAVLGAGSVRRVAANHKALGAACNATAECNQTGGPAVCASNGITGDGAYNCCRNAGGACTLGAHCCGDLICADNGIAVDGALNCCRNAGGACSSGSGCCGNLLCINGVCTAPSGARLPGQSCTSTAQCSQTGGVTVCADNGIAADGALNCCRNAGGACSAGAGCCGSLRCVNGVCTGVVTANLALGASCTSSSQCSQSGGPVTCASNGISSDGPLNCCRNEGGACTLGAHCCSDLVCASNGLSSDGPLNCCRWTGGPCTSQAGCCGALACVDGVCR